MNDEDGTKSEADGGGGDGGERVQKKDTEKSKSTSPPSSAISNVGSSSSSSTITEKGGGPGGRVSSPPSTTPPPAKKTPNDFIFGKLLGEGSFSSVYLAKDVKTGKEYAIKVCDKQHIIRERKAESIRREKEVLTILSANRSPTAPFFVHLYATFQDTQRLYFVVTFAHGGELLKFLHKVGSFELTCCRFYSAEILQALRHLHTIGIVHRDLKPENILLNENGHILITDFGSAKIHSQQQQQQQQSSSETSNSESNRTRSNSFVGTAQYVSPEVLKGRYSEVGPSADLWAFGCILFQLISGALPFQATNEFLIFQKILKLEYEFPTGFPPVVKDLVEQLLKIEPSERLGAIDEKLYESIQSHPFFENVDFEALSQETPPPIAPVSGGCGAVSASTLKSQHEIPESYEPGFNPRVIAERVLREDDDGFPPCEEDDDDESDAGGGEPLLVEGMDKLSIAGDTRVSNASPRLFPQDEIERQQRLEEQMRQSPAAHAAVKGNLILKQGLVSKRKGLFARRRLLFLTEGPHLFYCEPSTLNLKGEIPWSKQLRPEAKDFKIFFVHTPSRTYYLEDQGGYALEWVRAINEIHQDVYGNCSSNDA